VVSQADRLQRHQLAKGLGSLQDVGARVLGVILNRLAHRQGDSLSYYEYASTPSFEATARNSARRAAEPDPAPAHVTRASRSGRRLPRSLADPGKTFTTEQECAPVSPDEESSPSPAVLGG
jgi:succinoglycan biosynthesis transport protein ExoP